MTVIIPTAPPAPSVLDRANFDALSDAMVAWYAVGVAAMNLQNEENNLLHGQIHTKVDAAMAAGLEDAADNASAAAIARVAAELAEDNASGYALAGMGFRDQAQTYRDQAQEAAENAADAADIPDITGHAGEVLRVKLDGSGKEWFPGSAVTRVARAANVQLVRADGGKWISAAGTFTQTFAAEVDLTAGWWIRYSNDGTGVVTLTPAGGIDGQPSATVQPGELRVLHCDGTTLRSITCGPRAARLLPVLSPLAAAMNMTGGAVALANRNVAPVAADNSNGTFSIAASATAIIARPAASTTSAGSSADGGKTWTTRTLPSAATWRLGSDGAGFLAVAGGGTAVASSLDGNTWTARTALPGNAVNGPMGVAGLIGTPGTFLALPVTGSTAYLTTDYGASSTGVTLPGAISSIVSVPGLFVALTASATYYTSPSGATGSWTTRTFPGSSNIKSTVVAPDGATIWAYAATAGATVYRCTDGINSVDTGLKVLKLGNSATVTGCIEMNGVPVYPVSATEAWTVHNGKPVRQDYQGNASLGFNANTEAVRQGRIYAMGRGAITDGCIAVYDPDAADAARAFFI